MILHLYVHWGEGIAKDIKYRGSRIGLSFEEQTDADQDMEWEGIRDGGCDSSSKKFLWLTY